MNSPAGAGGSYLTSGPAYLSTQQDWTRLCWRVVVTQTSQGRRVFPFPVSCLGLGGAQSRGGAGSPAP